MKEFLCAGQAVMLFSVSMSEFAKRLRVLMEKRGLNQTELAKAAGIERVSITGYLSGSNKGKLPSFLNLVALARALHCTLEELTGMESLRDIEQQVAQYQPSPKALAFAEALEKLPEEDPRRKAIETLLLTILETRKEDKPPDDQSDRDVKPG